MMICPDAAFTCETWSPAGHTETGPAPACRAPPRPDATSPDTPRLLTLVVTGDALVAV